MPIARAVLPLLVLAAAAPASAQAAFPGINGRIAYSSQSDIWTVPAGGGAVTQLTSTPDDEAQSTFSPDGTRLAYRRRPAAGQPYQVFVMNADGSDQHQVSHDTVNATQPGWSPDGKTIVYRRSTAGDPNADVWAMNADGTNAHAVVTSPGADERYPVFSPDGTRLAFTSNREGQYEIYFSLADGSSPVRLTTNPGYDSAPSWAPDGTRIAFERGDALDVDTTKDVWIMNADGGAQTQLTFQPGVVDEGPAFSPDGTQIAFTSGRDGNYEIYRMNADGSAQTRVTTLATKEESPDWQAIPAQAPPPPPPPPPVVGGVADQDRDGDGLVTSRERRLHTSDLDRDSDDDGLSDRAEVRRHTSPAKRDSDRDGLTDGVEAGVTRGVSDPPGRVRGTARSRFKADADPRTHTNPRRRDTDLDGRSDGREDRNHNGRVDRGETDPRRR
jgi:dipeptidyl aminopeptidase/acylaminoacyl peptidase